MLVNNLVLLNIIFFLSFLFIFPDQAESTGHRQGVPRNKK